MNTRLQTIPVCYRPELVGLDAFGRSPCAAKPGEVLAHWQRRGLPLDVRDFAANDQEALTLSHDRAYVRAVLACVADNCFGNRRPQLGASLPFTSAAMLAAAREAPDNGRMSCASVLGVHHAGFDQGGGFCTFNGPVFAALALQRGGLVQRIAILDLDQQWGDGTHEILQHLGLRWIVLRGTPPLAPALDEVEASLKRRPRLVSSIHDCDLLLYQAGADAHVDDPLGGWMTGDQVQPRDRSVFETAATLGLPVAWNLAVGYYRDAAGGIAPVLTIHRRTHGGVRSGFR